jgi:hypothetical protein
MRQHGNEPAGQIRCNRQFGLCGKNIRNMSKRDQTQILAQGDTWKALEVFSFRDR